MSHNAEGSKGYPISILSYHDSQQSKYLCNICYLVLHDPVQGFCGHRFCKHCYENYTSTEKTACPACSKDDLEEDEEEQYLQRDQNFPDNAMKRQMNRLKVTCYFLTCTWSGLFKDLHEHLVACDKRPVQCTVCNETMSRDQISEHEKMHML